MSSNITHRKKIVLATCLEGPKLSASDLILKTALEVSNAKVTAAPWNGPFDNFADADMVVIRSTWDYFDKLNQFLSWVSRLEQAAIKIENSGKILRWNACKDYLFELQADGVDTLTTLRVDPTHDAINMAAGSNNWNKVVLKCLASGGAAGLSVFDVSDESALNQALKVAAPYQKHGLMLQEYRPEITNGELSLLFFAGEFSHAVLKRPKKGDFRVQSTYGGAYSLINPDEKIILTASEILQKAPGGPNHSPAYARIDGLLLDGRFRLMEMELTEPELMFEQKPASAKRLAEILISRL